MFNAQTALFLYAESSIHVGSGQALGAVDLAIQREQHTQLPVVPASGLKGAIRHWFGQHDGNSDLHKATFGPDTENAGDHAGAVAFSDARLLLFPMRSLKGVFSWVTCPALLHRFKRDLEAADHTLDWTIPTPQEDRVLCSDQNGVTSSGKIVLDEYVFYPSTNKEVKKIAKTLADVALPQNEVYDYWRTRLRSDLLIVDDNTFRDFTLHSTEVQARIRIDEDTGTTSGAKGNLFYQENLPPETLFYAIAMAQDDLSGALNGNGKANDLLDYVQTLNGQRLQIGGDASIGKGQTYVHFI